MSFCEVAFSIARSHFKLMFKLNKKQATWNLAFAAMATTGSMGKTTSVLAQEADPLEEVVVTEVKARGFTAFEIR